MIGRISDRKRMPIDWLVSNGKASNYFSEARVRQVLQLPESLERYTQMSGFDKIEETSCLVVNDYIVPILPVRTAH